jgi:hypothetical protein
MTCNKKHKTYTFIKNAGPQFNLLPDAEPMDYYILFFNDEILNNTVAFLGLIINMGLIPLPDIKHYRSRRRK